MVYTRCNSVYIYQIKKKKLSTPVDVWCEDRTPPISREEWVDNNIGVVNYSVERGVRWAPDYLSRTLINSNCLL